MGDVEKLTVEQRTELARLYFTAAQDATKEYDQRVFWLVAGSAAAFGYVQSRLPAASSLQLPCLLVFGWIALFVALIAIMLSFLWASNTHYLWARSWLWDDEECGGRAAASGRVIKIANWTALVAVFAGIGLISVFLLVNYFAGGVS